MKITFAEARKRAQVIMEKAGLEAARPLHPAYCDCATCMCVGERCGQ